MDGAAVFTALKQMNPQVKVILASAYGYNEKIRSVMQRGCRAFMPAVQPEELSTKARKFWILRQTYTKNDGIRSKYCYFPRHENKLVLFQGG